MYLYIFILGSSLRVYFNTISIHADNVDQATTRLTIRDGIKWDDVFILNAYRIEKQINVGALLNHLIKVY